MKTQHIAFLFDLIFLKKERNTISKVRKSESIGHIKENYVMGI